jgi:hypothetical protein
MPRRSILRASDADREGIAERLKRAAHEGRITTDELEHRVTAAFRARTYGELDQLVADLPRHDRLERRRGRGRAGTARRVAAAHPVAAVAITLAAVAAVALTLAMIALIAAAWSGWIVFGWIFFGSRRCGLRWARGHRPPPPRYVNVAQSRGRGYWA